MVTPGTPSSRGAPALRAEFHVVCLEHILLPIFPLNVALRRPSDVGVLTYRRIRGAWASEVCQVESASSPVSTNPETVCQVFRW